ncbi:MAG: type I restriction enzyme HsdR N-terminal domain-containing protein [Deltaproteobacteria bacterium]|nr:type I restriction enzyme HsdR N-terminal domain-containing protein [Deltaproteobacteria bacterium]
MSTQHLILGELTDFITGRTVADTHDERARQKIARFLVEEKDYAKDEIETRCALDLTLNGETGVVTVDFLIRLGRRAFAIVMFGPGSVVTRERSTLAAARLVDPYAVPLAMVTNGQEAEILETASGKVVATGLDGFPSRGEAERFLKTLVPERLSEERLDKEKRILFAFEVLAERECDEFTCSLWP